MSGTRYAHPYEWAAEIKREPRRIVRWLKIIHFCLVMGPIRGQVGR